MYKGKTIAELAKDGLAKPQDFGYWGPEDMFKTWGFCGIDNTHQSLLEKSNFECITKDLMKLHPEDFRIETYRHWAVGSIDRLVCRILKSEGEITYDNVTQAFIVTMGILDSLDDYCIYDETHYYNMEYDECVEIIKDLDEHLDIMINKSNDDWAESIYHELTRNLNIEFCPDADAYPKDNDIIEAVYNLQLWNKEAIDKWNEWTDQNGLERVPVRVISPNQLKLFEE